MLSINSIKKLYAKNSTLRRNANIVQCEHYIKFDSADGYTYEIHPLYIDQVLYAALWQRAVHSGESVSRMLDFAIRNYMGRLLEGLLRSQRQGSFRSQRNSAYWNARHARRLSPYADFFINYACKTLENGSSTFNYVQYAQIIDKKDLSNAQIVHSPYTTT